MADHAVIVDPYSSGVLYAPALRRAGFDPVAVRSVPLPVEEFTSAFRPDDFAQQYLADDGVETLAGRLSDLKPVAVLPGSESGVHLADRLSARLTPDLTNAPELAACRRHKGRMIDAVRNAGLPVPLTRWVRDPAEAADWLTRSGVAGHALVVKPATSVSTDGVTLVPAGGDVLAAVSKLIGRTNATGVVNTDVVIQRRMFGVEYVVNTFSHNGRHVVTDICRYGKVANDGNFAVYRDVEFLPYEGHQDLLDYVTRALDALGFRFGAAHTEIMLTDDGPRLVEVNSRIAGSGMAAAGLLATGDNAVQRTIRYLCGSRDFPLAYKFLRTVKVAMFIAPHSGTVSNLEALDRIRILPTCRNLLVRVRNGDRIQATSDLLSSIRFGSALLADRDAEAVHRDYEQLRSFAADVRIDR